MLETVVYVVACLILPAIWGWIAHWLFTRSAMHRRLPGPSVQTTLTHEAASVWDYQI